MKNQKGIKMDRADLLNTSKELINGERAVEYGDAKESFKEIATIWSIVLNKDIKAREVAACMIGLKLVRFSNSQKGHLDSLIDMAGYAALAGEMLDD